MIRFVLPEDAAKDRIPIPLKEYRDCQDCQSSKIYNSKEAALQHLSSEHYGKRNFSEMERVALANYIDSRWDVTKQYKTRKVRDYVVRVVRVIRKFHTRLHDMVEALANQEKDGKETATSTGLPSTLVTAFEVLSTFLLAAGRVMPLMETRFSNWTAPGDSYRFDNLFENGMNGYNSFVLHRGFRAEFALTDAMRDIIRLIRTGTTSAKVSYVAAGSEHIAAMLINSIVLRNVNKKDRVVDLYTRQTSRLVCSFPPTI